MKVRMDKDEWYPVYSLVDDDGHGFDVEAEPEAVERWKKAEEAFTAAQDEMQVVAEAAAEAQRVRREQEKAEKEAAEKAERERIEEEQRAGAAAKQAARDEMWRRIGAEGGVVYDSKGNRIGVVGKAQHFGPATITPLEP